MTARLRTLGIGGSLAALLTSGTLLFPAAQPAQAVPPSPDAAACENLHSVIVLAFVWGQWGFGWERVERYYALGCE